MTTPTVSPAGWFADEVDRFLGRYDPDTPAARWYDVASALGPDGMLGGQHGDFAREGATPAAAAKWVVAEHVGVVATALAYTYLRAGAAVLELDEVRFGVHPLGWVQRADLGTPRVLVAEGHCWAGLAGVTTTADPTALADAVVACVRRFGEPFVARGRELARVGARSLWAEVVDIMAISVATEPGRRVDVADLAALDTLLHAQSAPWRSRPELWLTDHHGDPLVIGRKGGCCLAYQTSAPEAESETETETETEAPEDPWQAAWSAAFPAADDPGYCSTCCLRERADCEARVRWQHDWERTAGS